MIFSFIFTIITAIAVGISIVLAFKDKELIASAIIFTILLAFDIIAFICCDIPDCKNQAIKDYTSGKYRKEVTYKMVQKDSLMVPIDSTITYKLIKDEEL